MRFESALFLLCYIKKDLPIRKGLHLSLCLLCYNKIIHNRPQYFSLYVFYCKFKLFTVCFYFAVFSAPYHRTFVYNPVSDKFRFMSNLNYFQTMTSMKCPFFYPLHTFWNFHGFQIVILTLLDNLGFTDNYMECMIPTVGVYPIATANEKDQISAPLMSRFAVIDIPDYTPEEKKAIFQRFALPKVLKRMGLKDDECIMTDEALDAVIEMYSETTGIRDLEQAAEHIAANALYQIEVHHMNSVTFDGAMVRNLLL